MAYKIKTQERKQKRRTEDLIKGGVALSLGAGAIQKLPASAARTGVLRGMGTAGAFFSPMVNIHAAGIVTKQLKDLKKLKRRER